MLTALSRGTPAKQPAPKSSSDESSPSTPSTSKLQLANEDSPSSQATGSALVTPKDWLKSYKIPKRFSCAVEAGLNKQFLTANQINEMARDVCLSVLNHTRYPNKRQREVVAKLVVDAYPFLKDPLLSDKSTPWGSWERKIQNRFKKLQRKKTFQDTCGEKQPTCNKKGRPSLKEEKSWSVLPQQTESDETIDSCIKDIQKEWKKTRKDHRSLQVLMDKAYARRREMVLLKVTPLVEILKVFPPLENMLYIKADLGRLMGNNDLTNQIKGNFKDVWTQKILKYATLHGKCSGIIEEMNTSVDSGCDETECQQRAALKIVATIMKQKQPNKKTVNGQDQDAVLKIIKDTESVDEIIKTRIQPIILMTNFFGEGLIYVVAETIIVCDITTQKIGDALVILLAMYYLYNMDYKEGKNAFHFFELALMGILPDKCPVSVTTMLNVLSNMK